MTGEMLRDFMRRKRIRQYEVAKELNINEFTLSRWLRGDMNEDKALMVMQAINAVRGKLEEDEDMLDEELGGND